MYQSFIGLEIHIQLLTETKIFCGCRAAFGDQPNTNICPVCMGYPGVLPALNEKAIRLSYLVARALNCSLSSNAVFERKNYFYPDLPKNYQISQYSSPVGRGGYMDLEFRHQRKRIRIHDVHLEEDAGKMIHAGDISLLDYNRTGTPLLEIVTEPDLEIGEEAELFLQNFRRMVRYLGVCDGNMEEGSMRCDANVSVNIQGKGLGNKVEIKNLNSSRFVKKALTFEIARHEEILERGGTILQETRLWNENRDLTEGMRSKEEANDYRYFPEPDLPPFKPTPQFLDEIEQALVELPDFRRGRMMQAYSLSEAQLDFIIDEKARADFYERSVALGADAESAAAWMGSDVKKLLNRHGLELDRSPLTPARFAQLLKLLADGRIHGKIAKQVLDLLFEENKDPIQIISEHGWEQISDAPAVARLVDEVIAENSHAADAIRKGDPKPIPFLVGQVMKKSGGRAEPQLVQATIKDRLQAGAIHLVVAGGAITGRVVDGIVTPLGTPELRAQVDSAFTDDERTRLGKLRIDELSPRASFSEEMTPEDWASLVSSIARLLSSDDTTAIVVAHGTDTLAYSASLLFWLFADTSIPIVLTASTAPGVEAAQNLRGALLHAVGADPGIFVVIAGRVLSPVNLKFERVSPDGFANWNLEKPLFAGKAIGSTKLEFALLKERLEQAMSRTFVAKVFPGMRAESLIEVMSSGVRALVLELYDTGTANLRATPFSIRKALQHARENGVRLFCTSQQEGIVDFSEYSTAHELWKEGAIPMGRLTTESAYTRLLAAMVVAESEEEAFALMEGFDADARG